MFAFRHRIGRADFTFTDREGGYSPPPYDTLNLGFRVGDDPAQVKRNFSVVAAGLGVPAGQVATMRQTHSAEVAEVVDGASSPSADAMVTTVPDLVLCVRVADCVPVLLADEGAGVVGAAHAGRTGLALGVVPATVDRMRSLGASHLVAVIGPHVCAACYEVPEDLREQVSATVPEAWATSRSGTPALDLGAGVRAQLDRAGCEVVGAARCTKESDDLFSYRRQGGRSGRQAGLVRLAGG